jgi:pSer/pThr/pTyr-binding forkhead associated (FHA) protein
MEISAPGEESLVEVRLVVLAGEHQGREIPQPETIFLIGRSRQCHLRPHCREVSGLHCAIAAWAGKVRVRDLKSRNGTLLNGRAIVGEAEARDGDELRVGSLVFGFRIKHDRRAITAKPIRDESDVKWLLAADGDVPGHRTTHISPGAQVEADSRSADGDVWRTDSPEDGAPHSRQGISAGQSFHEYFAQRKRRR